MRSILSFLCEMSAVDADVLSRSSFRKELVPVARSVVIKQPLAVSPCGPASVQRATVLETTCPNVGRYFC